MSTTSNHSPLEGESTRAKPAVEPVGGRGRLPHPTGTGRSRTQTPVSMYWKRGVRHWLAPPPHQPSPGGSASATPPQAESDTAPPGGAGGAPALPGSLHPMTSSDQRDKIAEAFQCRLSLKEVHLSSVLFVIIRGSSLLMTSRFSSNDPHGRAGGRLNTYPRPCTLLKSPARW